MWRSKCCSGECIGITEVLLLQNIGNEISKIKKEINILKGRFFSFSIEFKAKFINKSPLNIHCGNNQ